MPAFVVALVGAAGTGKSTLARHLQDALVTKGGDVAVVDNPGLPMAATDLTLLLALDLPAKDRADDVERERVDADLRQGLIDAGGGFSIVSGQGPERLRAALAAIAAARRSPPALDAAAPRWKHLCARCGDPDCERHHLPRA